MMNKPLTIVNIENTTKNLKLISKFLKKDFRFKLLAQVHTAKDALRICSELMPDIIIIDSDITDMEHKELVEKIYKIHPKSLRLISVRKFYSDEETRELSNAGVRGFAFKEEDIIAHLRYAEQEAYANAVAMGFIKIEKPLSIILCHDDNSSFHSYGGYLYLAKMLTFFSYFKLLAQVHSGKNALIICPEMQPDFIIMPVNLPDMSALELAPQLMELCPISAIIVSSISGDPEIMQSLMLADVRYFMSQPFSEVDVHETLVSIDRYRKQSGI